MKTLLELSALILGIVNGLILLKNYLNDKPKLNIEPVYPDLYQWWFRLPDGKIKDVSTRKYGFLVYVAIYNKGLRKVSLSSWRLFLRTAALKQNELDPISIPEPQGLLSKSGHVKTFPVLGQKTLNYSGDTLIDSGTSIAGMAYYIAEFWGSERYSPIVANRKILGEFVIRDVFGSKAKAKIVFQEAPIDYVKSIIDNIELIH